MKYCGHCDRPHHDISKCNKPAKYTLAYTGYESRHDDSERFFLCGEHGDAFMAKHGSLGFDCDLINSKLEVMK